MVLLSFWVKRTLLLITIVWSHRYTAALSNNAFFSSNFNIQSPLSREEELRVHRHASALGLGGGNRAKPVYSGETETRRRSEIEGETFHILLKKEITHREKTDAGRSEDARKGRAAATRLLIGLCSIRRSRRVSSLVAIERARRCFGGSTHRASPSSTQTLGGGGGVL